MADIETKVKVKVKNMVQPQSQPVGALAVQHVRTYLLNDIASSEDQRRVRECRIYLRCLEELAVCFIDGNWSLNVIEYVVFHI